MVVMRQIRKQQVRSRSVGRTCLPGLTLLLCCFTALSAAPDQGAGSTSTSVTIATPEQRSAQLVFRKWLNWQRVVHDKPLGQQQLTGTRLTQLHAKLPAALRERLAFLKLPPRNAASPKPNDGGTSEDSWKPYALAVRSMLQVIEADMPRFIQLLTKHKFTSIAINKAEEQLQVTVLTKRYRAFFESLFATDGLEDRAQLVAIANRFFEFSFQPATNPVFRKLIEHPANFPVARLLYTTIWYNLSGNGWRTWHNSTLGNITLASSAGREIVYVAGGSDIYYPIIRGVRKLRIIDPMLPTQTRYYSEGWRFLIRGRGKHGGIGDRIVFKKPAIYMKRVLFSQGPEFTLGPNKLKRSTTVWAIHDSATGKNQGTFTLERRPVVQADFAEVHDRDYLVSFNELYFIVGADAGGWGIDPAKFPAGIKVHVKQLRQPLGRKVMKNMRATRWAKFSFIRLGTSVD